MDPYNYIIQDQFSIRKLGPTVNAAVEKNLMHWLLDHTLVCLKEQHLIDIYPIPNTRKKVGISLLRHCKCAKSKSSEKY
jgi:hypothetical protein